MLATTLNIPKGKRVANRTISRGIFFAMGGILPLKKKFANRWGSLSILGLPILLIGNKNPRKCSPGDFYFSVVMTLTLILGLSLRRLLF